MRKSTDEEQERIFTVKAKLLNGIKEEIEAGSVTKPELLCLMAHITGMLIAMQDQRTMTPKHAMELVTANIQQGNFSAIEQLLGETKGSA